MRDRVLISAGLASSLRRSRCTLSGTAFALGQASTPAPKLQLPVNEKDCVAPPALMRASHMQLLIDWREDVVRRGERSICRLQRQSLR